VKGREVVVVPPLKGGNREPVTSPVFRNCRELRERLAFFPEKDQSPGQELLLKNALLLRPEKNEQFPTREPNTLKLLMSIFCEQGLEPPFI
jgi:hypothetical protein